MNAVNRYFWDTENCSIITTAQLKADFDSLCKTHDTDCATFNCYVQQCTGPSGTLQLLQKGPGQFNSDGGNDAGVVMQYEALIESMCGCVRPDVCDVTISIDGYVLQAYDNAAFMQALINAVHEYAEDIG